MSRAASLALLICAAECAVASGPVTPEGWDGSIDAILPNGQQCCLPADLNGTGLVGGAFVLISSNQDHFGVFALTYRPPLHEHWQLLEQHPISQLAGYSVSVDKPGLYPFGHIKVCGPSEPCRLYFTPSAKEELRQGNER
jgi:hypothetical protein